MDVYSTELGIRLSFKTLDPSVRHCLRIVCHIFERLESRLVHIVFQKKLELFPVSDERVKVPAEFVVTERLFSVTGKVQKLYNFQLSQPLTFVNQVLILSCFKSCEKL
jgi:hypothetical protein